MYLPTSLVNGFPEMLAKAGLTSDDRKMGVLAHTPEIPKNLTK